MQLYGRQCVSHGRITYIPDARRVLKKEAELPNAPPEHSTFLPLIDTMLLTMQAGFRTTSGSAATMRAECCIRMGAEALRLRA